jgi:hypothetical protein
MTDIRDELNRAEALAIGALLRREAPTPDYLTTDAGVVDRSRVRTVKARFRDSEKQQRTGVPFVILNAADFRDELHELVEG